MNAPAEDNWTALKRFVRFCLGAPRVVWVFTRQERVDRLDVYSDSDHAGCLKTRKNTSCVIVMHGSHCIKTAATTQSVISLSTGESEFYALVKAISVALGGQAMCADMGTRKTLRCWVDATAGKGIASRRGVGKIRHLHTQTLWSQKIVQDGKVKLSKVDGDLNPADIGTKHLDGQRIWKLLKLMSIEAREGRSDLALRSAGGDLGGYGPALDGGDGEDVEVPREDTEEERELRGGEEGDQRLPRLLPAAETREQRLSNGGHSPTPSHHLVTLSRASGEQNTVVRCTR